MSTCTTENERTIHRGSTEYLKATLTADVTLDAQAVAFSIDDGETWLTAEGIGSAGNTRTYRHLLTPAEQPDEDGTYEVLVRVVDDPEVPIFPVGSLTIES